MDAEEARRRRLTDRAVVWRALLEAYENVEGLSDAYHHNPEEPTVQNCQRFMNALDRAGKNYFGKTVSGARAERYENMVSIPIDKLLKGEF